MTRRKKALNLKPLGVFVIFVCLLVSSCNERPKLQDGFALLQTSNGSDILAKQSMDGQYYNSVVYPHITRVKDNERFIIGLREDRGLGDEFPESLKDQPYGYFIYDKTTEERVLGLSKDELAELSEERGIELRLE